MTFCSNNHHISLCSQGLWWNITIVWPCLCSSSLSLFSQRTATGPDNLINFVNFFCHCYGTFCCYLSGNFTCLLLCLRVCECVCVYAILYGKPILIDYIHRLLYYSRVEITLSYSMFCVFFQIFRYLTKK